MQEYDLYKVIEKISVRTGMYIGDQTLSNVDSYLSGYEEAMNEAGIRNATYPSLVHFRDWLKVRFGFVSDVPGSSNMILALAVGYECKKALPWEKMKIASEAQHVRSLELFFGLVKEYKKERGGATN
jgi:hypothetical protein